MIDLRSFRSIILSGSPLKGSLISHHSIRRSDERKKSHTPPFADCATSSSSASVLGLAYRALFGRPSCADPNKKVAGAAEFHITHEGRLYLFPSAKQMKMFRENPDKYADADLALHGYCPVCKVEMGKDVAGKADVAAVYGGLRYLFPGKKQLDMFVSNPAKYVIQ